MKVLLINPAIRPNSPKCILNVGLAYVASALQRAGIDIEILDVDAFRYSDSEVERMIRTRKFDVAGIGDLVSHYRWVKWLAGVIKSHHPEVPVIAGNTVATSIPELLLAHTHVDVAVLGEGDITAVELVKALCEGRALDEVKGIAFKRDGAIAKTPARPVIDPIDSIPFPNYDLFDMSVYLEKSRWHVDNPELVGIPLDKIVSMPVVTARGCPYRCTFCYHAFQEKKYRYRSPENIIAEILAHKSKYGANFIQFWDELSFFHARQARRLLELFIDRKVNIAWYGSARSELISKDDFELALLFRKAGCKGLGFSLENGNESILASMNKQNTPQDFVVQARMLQAAGVPTFTSVVFGYPQESPQTIAETFEVLRDARIYPSVGFLQPMPGTPMFAAAVAEGHINDVEAYLMRMGDRQDLRINLTQMSEGKMMGLIETHLRSLNAELELDLPAQDLIRTRVYRAAKSEAFMTSFGVAGRVFREAGESSDPTRKSEL